MDDLTIHHFGLASNDLDRSIEVFRSLGYIPGEIFIDPIQKVKLVFVSRIGETPIEIICDLDETGPTKNIIAKSGNSFYHVCYAVIDIEKTIEDFKTKGFMLKAKPVLATAFKGKKIAWLYNRFIGLIELLEK